MQQSELFENPPALPPGFVYAPEFLTRAEEGELLQLIRALPLHEAQYRQYTARRRIVSYGGRYDFTHHELLPAGPIPDFLYPLRARIAAWSGIAASEFNHALISEYQPGTPLGWHRDVHEFGTIVGVSLAGEARLRLRPYPPTKGRNADVIALTIEPRSIYRMANDARWNWQHAVSATKMLRYSITFRTLERRVPHASEERPQPPR